MYNDSLFNAFALEEDRCAFGIPRCLKSKQTALPPTLAPRLIDREAAAAYVNVSPNTFDAMVEMGIMPKPKQLTARRKAWDVRELNVAVDNLPTVGAADNDDTWNDIDAA
jgi:hypothetical protein